MSGYHQNNKEEKSFLYSLPFLIYVRRSIALGSMGNGSPTFRASVGGFCDPAKMCFVAQESFTSICIWTLPTIFAKGQKISN